MSILIVPRGGVHFNSSVILSAPEEAGRGQISVKCRPVLKRLALYWFFYRKDFILCANRPRSRGGGPRIYPYVASAFVAPKAHFENPAPSQSRICVCRGIIIVMLFEERFGAVTLNQSTSGFFYRLIHGRNCSKPSRNRAALKIFLGNGLLQVGGRHLKSDTLLVAKMSAKPVY